MHRSLEGIRVVAVEQAVAAPLCTRHLADLGAEVIKIERPDGGDFARAYDDDVLGESSHFVWLNRGKKSVVLDLKSERGRADLRRLLGTADVLVSNLAPGAFERIVPDAELDRYETLIRCHISGYGPSGPYARRKAYDLLVQGEAGVIAATGTLEQRARPGVSLADLSGGTYAFAAINAALVERDRTGRGQRIDIALFDVLLEWMSPLLLTTKYSGSTPPPAGRGHASITPYGPYATSDGMEVQIAVQNEGQWQRLCSIVLERDDLLAREDLRGNANRQTNRVLVEREVAQAISRLPKATLLQRLERADVPYGEFNEVRDVLGHPQAVATHRWTPALTEAGELVEVVTSPLLRESAGEVLRIPRLGEHTDEVLSDLERRSVALG